MLRRRRTTIKPGNPSYDLDVTLLGMLFGSVGKERAKEERTEGGLSSREMSSGFFLASVLRASCELGIRKIYIEAREIPLGPKVCLHHNLVLCGSLNPNHDLLLVMSLPISISLSSSPSAPFPPSQRPPSPSSSSAFSPQLPCLPVS